jgi:hypothetical protein
MDEDSKKGSLTSLKDIVASIFNDKTLPFNPDDAKIWKVWDEVVDPAFAVHARPLWIKEGRLRVSVKHPIVLQELNFMATDIINDLNRVLGRKAVHRIDFSLTYE